VEELERRGGEEGTVDAESGKLKDEVDEWRAFGGGMRSSARAAAAS